MAKRYSLRKIRQLLSEGFSDKELRDFCFDTFDFRNVYYQLAQDSGKDEIIRRLLEYADQQSKFAILLDWAKEQNPDKYNQHYPYITEVPQPQPAASPDPKRIPTETVRPRPAASPRPWQIVPYLLLGAVIACLLLLGTAFVVLPKLWPGVVPTPVEQAVEFVPVPTSMTAPTPGSDSNGLVGTVTPTPPPPSLPSTTTAVAAPTVITPPPEVIAAQSTAIANAVVVFEEDFSSNTKGWFEGGGASKTADYVTQFLEGKYRLTLKSKQLQCSEVMLVPNLGLEDFRLSLETKIIEALSIKDTSIVVTFRQNKRGDFYLLKFNLDNTYELWIWKDNKWGNLHQASGNGSFNLEPGVSNTFELVAAGSQFTIYANNQLLTTIANSELNEPGAIWFGSQLKQAGEVVTVDFDNLKIAEIPLDKTKADIEATATAGAIAAATARVAPTATEIARATAEADGIAKADILFQDDFSTNSHGWWTKEFEDEFGFSEVQIGDGKYRQILKSKKGTFFAYAVPDFLSENFWLQVEVKLIETSTTAGNAEVTIIFRKNQKENYVNGDFYGVSFHNNGTYQVTLRQNGEWQAPLIQDDTVSTTINLQPGVTNTFAILVKGSIFTIYANGQKLTTVTDITLKEAGEVSLGIGLNEADQTLTVDFDNLIIKEAP